MPKRSLFAILCDLPWWVSLLVAALVYTIGSTFSVLIGAAAALPFICVAGYVVFVRIRRGPALDAPAMLKALRSATAEDMRAMLAEVFAADRYLTTDAPGGDLRLERNGYITLVRFRRWRAQTIHTSAMRELQQTMRAQKADHGMYITAGSIAASARKQAADSGIALVEGVALAEMVRRTSGARKALARASQEAAKA